MMESWKSFQSIINENCVGISECISKNTYEDIVSSEGVNIVNEGCFKEEDPVEKLKCQSNKGTDSNIKANILDQGISKLYEYDPSQNINESEIDWSNVKNQEGRLIDDGNASLANNIIYCTDEYGVLNVLEANIETASNKVQQSNNSNSNSVFGTLLTSYQSPVANKEIATPNHQFIEVIDTENLPAHSGIGEQNLLNFINSSASINKMEINHSKSNEEFLQEEMPCTKFINKKQTSSEKFKTNPYMTGSNKQHLRASSESWPQKCFAQKYKQVPEILVLHPLRTRKPVNPRLFASSADAAKKKSQSSIYKYFDKNYISVPLINEGEHNKSDLTQRRKQIRVPLKGSDMCTIKHVYYEHPKQPIKEQDPTNEAKINSTENENLTQFPSEEHLVTLQNAKRVKKIYHMTCEKENIDMQNINGQTKFENRNIKKKPLNNLTKKQKL